MIEIRNVKKEIDQGVPKQKAVPPEIKERLSILKSKIDSIEYHRTSLNDYEAWFAEYNEIVGRFIK